MSLTLYGLARQRAVAISPVLALRGCPCQSTPLLAGSLHANTLHVPSAPCQAGPDLFLVHTALLSSSTYGTPAVQPRTAATYMNRTTLLGWAVGMTWWAKKTVPLFFVRARWGNLVAVLYGFANTKLEGKS